MYINLLTQLNRIKDDDDDKKDDDNKYLLPYNLLLTKRWMMMIPRIKDEVRGEYPFEKISVNGLNFYGSFFVKSKEARNYLINTVGIMDCLVKVQQKE